MLVRELMNALQVAPQDAEVLVDIADPSPRQDSSLLDERNAHAVYAVDSRTFPGVALLEL